MGNDCCKKKDPKGIRALKRFESSLGFKGKRGVEWFERLKKEELVSGKILTKLKIEEISEDLSVNVCKHKGFLEMFREDRANGSYNCTILSTLGILLTDKHKDEKLGLLWKNYADLKSGILTENGLLLLIRDIIQIFLDFSPNYVKKERTNNPGYNDYCFKLMLVRIQLADELFGKLKDPEMDKQKFFSKFASESGEKLMEPNKLRKFALGLEQNLEDAESRARVSVLFSDEFKQEDLFSSARAGETKPNLDKEELESVSINKQGLENGKNCNEGRKDSGAKGFRVNSAGKNPRILSNLNSMDKTSCVLEKPISNTFNNSKI